MSNKGVHNCTLCDYDGGTQHSQELATLRKDIASLEINNAQLSSADRPYTYFWTAVAFIGVALVASFGFSQWLDANHSNPELVERQEAHAQCMSAVRNTRMGESAKLQAFADCNQIMERATLTPETDDN